VISRAFAGRALPLVAVAAGVALAAALAVFGRAVTLAAGPTVRLPLAAAVATAARACPAPGLAGSPAAQVAVFATGGHAGAGRVVVSRLAGPPGTVFTVGKPGTLTVAGVRPAPGAARPPPARRSGARPAVVTQPGRGGVLVQATGAMAGGLAAEQAVHGVPAGCAAPATTFWFVGPGQSLARGIQLYLANPGGQAADVSVAAFTDAGPLQTSTDTGISVPPRSMITQSLGTWLHGSKVAAVEVRTSVGQVAAALAESRGAGQDGSWIPGTAAPATSVVIPGIPAVPGTRQLFVVVPGTQDARLTVTAITSHGTYQPTGGGGLDIPGGSAAAIPLPSLAGVPGALRVSANVPLTAAVLVPGGPAGGPGVLCAASQPITEQGVVAYSPGGGAISQLVLSAPGRPVRAEIRQAGPGGPGAGKRPAAPSPELIRIPPHRTRVVQLARPAGVARGTPFATVITPRAGSGPLYAGLAIVGSGAGGGLRGVLPVASALTTVSLPAVRATEITITP
jgi:hypothetical protein